MRKRRTQKRLSFRWVAGFLIATTLLALGIVKAGRWTLTDIVLTGNDTVPRQDLVTLMGVRPGDPLWEIPASELEHRLESHILVAEALVVRRIPDTLEVRIRERKPFLLIPSEDRFVVLDGAGFAIELVRGMPDQRLPYYAAPDLDVPIALGQLVVEERTHAVLALLASLTPENREIVWEVVWRNDMWSVFESRGIEIFIGTIDDVNEKLALARGILQDSDLLARHGGVRYLNMSNPDTPVFSEEPR